MFSSLNHEYSCVCFPVMPIQLFLIAHLYWISDLSVDGLFSFWLISWFSFVPFIFVDYLCNYPFRVCHPHFQFLFRTILILRCEKFCAPWFAYNCLPLMLCDNTILLSWLTTSDRTTSWLPNLSFISVAKGIYFSCSIFKLYFIESLIRSPSNRYGRLF